MPVYRDSVCRGGVPVHGALAELDGHASLLIGPGGAGKSTCCRRLRERWRPLCDDEALVVKDDDKIYRVHPFPTWSDYLWNRSNRTWNVQRSVPLKGLFFLEQADKDKVEPLGGAKAAVLMNASVNQVFERFYQMLDESDGKVLRRQVFENACRMVKQIPSYRLSVSLHGKFWERMEEAIQGCNSDENG